MAKDLPSKVWKDARTIQTGFVKFWDDTGGQDAEHLRYGKGGYGWHPQDYAFKIPRVKAGAPTEKEDIRVGRPLKKNTFRMVPLGLPYGDPGSKEANEYVKKLLFTWAINLDPEWMADLFGTELRQYEKPERTRSGRGALKTKRRAGTQPLSLDAQKTKFLWARLIHDNSQIIDHKNTYSQGYEADTDNSYRITMNQASRKAMRELYDELDDTLKVGIGGGEQLDADSAEEIMIALAGQDLSKLGWNDEDASVEKIIEDMEEIMGAMPLRVRESKIDIPAKFEEEIEQIVKLIRGQTELVDRIRRGGIEVTEQHGRLAEMYGSGDVGDGQQFLDHYIPKIKEDIVKQYRRLEINPAYEGTGKRTIGEQFYDRGIGVEGSSVDTLTWSEPAYGGVAFFAVYIPGTRPLSESDISIIPYFLTNTPSVWRGIMRQQGIHENHTRIKDAVKELMTGVVKTKKGVIIKTHTLGTNYAQMVGFGKQGIVSTKVGASAPKKVAKELFDMVEEAAINIGNRLTLSRGATFTNWVQAQHDRAEKAAWGIHRRKGAGWREWLAKTGGKEDPKPKDAIDWTQPIHPRPFLWMTGVGQAELSRQTWNQNFAGK